MSLNKLLFLAGLVLAPFTGGLSLIVSALAVWRSFKTYMYTGSDFDYSQLPDVVPAAEESERRLARILAEAPARRERYLIERYANLPGDAEPAYAMYQCSNSFCRHRERLATWHGDSQECSECGRRMYREE